MSVTRWVFEKDGNREYNFPRNPDWSGGDSNWSYPSNISILKVVGGSFGRIHSDGFSNAVRTLRFTAVTGAMKRQIEDFYLSNTAIRNCRDHLYPISKTFNCKITGFNAAYRPTLASQDTYNIDMSLVKVI